MSNFDARYPDARTTIRQPHWPDDVRVISQDGLNFIGVDSSGRMYWDGKPIEIARTFSLTWWQKAGAVIGLLSGVSLALVDVARFLGYGWDRLLP